MKPVDIKPSTYINSGKEIIDKGPKFKVGDIIRISKYKNIFSKGNVPNWSEKVFITKVKNTVSWTSVINDLNVEGIVGRFYEKESQKKIKKSLELKK